MRSGSNVAVLTGAKSARVRRSLSMAALCVLCGAVPGFAQRFVNLPPTDVSAQASPLASAPRSAVVDSSLQASPMIGPPVSYAPSRASTIAAGTDVQVVLERSIDSGRLKNGEDASARLAAPVRLESGEVLPAGTPVVINVIETLPAGVLSAEGEFSLQAQQIGSVELFTNIETFRGKPGPRDVADAAPAVGTDAGLPAGARLTFRVLPQPSAAGGPPEESALSPGAVDGIAVGGPPPPGSQTARAGRQHFEEQGTHPGTARFVPGANDSFGPVQHLGQVTSAPNQIAPEHSEPRTGNGAATAPH